ncbi:hypothetical protein M758_7G176600 [Ceratodon purpureus]|uniref:Transmembrane protein 120 homolog n=1 Tax=Ceratodon purpureus TaxID=3225 RepID=A0A8T0H9B4_CERPU|nr:hypothetical protein KC19_7G179500 [Ceratodon purpureus]KAG0611921.1 hypothetical protein M758_7G176600 [Ceratodon purpureus]
MGSDSGLSPAEVSAGFGSVSERVARLAKECRALQETVSLHTVRWHADSDVLSKQAVALVASMKELVRDVYGASERKEISQYVAEKLVDELSKVRTMLYDGDVASLLPAKANGFFLRVLLGPANVRATRKDGRYKVKEEYNAYRDNTAIIFLAFPIVLLALKKNLWNECFPALPVQIYQAWLLFFYTSLAFRENILRVNGSDIRPWWVYHHYLAMAMALVSLTWGIQGHPDCSRKQHGVELFLDWAVMQGVAMLLQNRYQRQRLYTRIALGKAGRMDVVWGETSGVKGQLWVLYPLLFTLQAFQCYIGALLLRTAIIEDDCEWQMVACGLLLIAMAFGNFSNTIATLVAKAKVKAKMKKMKHVGNQMLGQPAEHVAA